MAAQITERGAGGQYEPETVRYTKVILKPPPPRNGTEPFFKRTLQQGGAQTYCHTHMVEQGGIHPVTAQGEMTNEGGGTQAQEL